MRRLATGLFVVALAVGACSGGFSTTPPAGGNPTGNPTGNNAASQPPAGGGNATATVKLGGQSYSLEGGRCYDGGARGMDVAVGPGWTDAKDNYLRLLAFSDRVESVSGKIGDKMFVLEDASAKGSISGGAGTFSGKNTLDDSTVEGTFTCK